MKEIIIKNELSKKFKRSYPLISPTDLIEASQKPTNEWVKFVSQQKAFIGYGYLGHQNKGIGWMVSFDESQPINDNLLKQLFNEAFEKRQGLMNDPLTTAFRLFNGEGDGLGGIIIDWYDGYLVISWYNQVIYSFKEQLLTIIQNCFGEELLGVYEKVRFEGKGLAESSHLSGNLAPEPLLIQENGVSYATYLNEGLMTGIFLDQREVRNQLIEGLAMGKTVLNTFSYTGAFSVASLIGGAEKTTSVDLAKRSLNKTREMFEVNGINASEQDIIVMDVFDYYKYALRKNLSFDVIVLDPPSFSRNKKKTFSVAKNYNELVAEAVAILNKDGILIASSNAANVPLPKFEKLVEQGINESKRKFEKMALYQLPVDFVVNKNFKEGNYLKVMIYKIF